MKILLTGSTGYIAQRLLPVLLEHKHKVVCCVRNKNRFDDEKFAGFDLEVIEVDFLKEESLIDIPSDIDVAYYPKIVFLLALFCHFLPAIVSQNNE